MSVSALRKPSQHRLTKACTRPPKKRAAGDASVVGRTHVPRQSGGKQAMIWTAWNNGSHHRSGAGYGFKVDAADRDRHFKRDWTTVIIELPGNSGTTAAEVKVAKKSFWGAQCRELISQDIGVWLIAEGHAPWTAGSPPKFEVEASGVRRFVVKQRVAV